MHRLEDQPPSRADHEAVRRDQPGHDRCGQRDKCEDTGVGEEEPLYVAEDDRALGGPARCEHAGLVAG